MILLAQEMGFFFSQEKENNFILHEEMKRMEILVVIQLKRSKVDLGSQGLRLW